MFEHLVRVQEKLVLLLAPLKNHHKLLLRLLVLHLKLPLLKRRIYLHVVYGALELYLPLQQPIEKDFLVKSQKHLSGFILVGHLLRYFVLLVKAHAPVAYCYLLHKAVKVFVEVFPERLEQLLTPQILGILLLEVRQVVDGVSQFLAEMLSNFLEDFLPEARLIEFCHKLEIVVNVLVHLVLELQLLALGVVQPHERLLVYLPLFLDLSQQLQDVLELEVLLAVLFGVDGLLLLSVALQEAALLMCVPLLYLAHLVVNLFDFHVFVVGDSHKLAQKVTELKQGVLDGCKLSREGLQALEDR